MFNDPMITSPVLRRAGMSCLITRYCYHSYGSLPCVNSPPQSPSWVSCVILHTELNNPESMQ